MMVHEDALRKFLRWLVGCPLLDQIFPAGSGETLEEEGATLVAFCDSNWGSESSVGRKSTSGGVSYVVAGSFWYCVKGYSRLQTVVALSSAEAELFAIAEAAKEIAGLGQLAFSHLGLSHQALRHLHGQCFCSPDCRDGRVSSAHATCGHQVVFYSG